MNEKPLEVIEAANSQVGSPYVFGAWGEYCTPANRRKRARSDHPTIVSKCQVLNGSKSSCDGCRYQGDRMFDCRGFTHWCLEQAGIKIDGQGATSQYNTDTNWLEKGDIADMPECVCCVFVANGNKKEHTGLYISTGETIECSAGVQRKSLDKRWTHYAIPKGLYTLDEIAEIRKAYPKPKRIVRNGDRGSDVKEVQEILNAKGYNCGEVDGIFGKKTLAAVKAFQQDHGLTPDGIVGSETWAMLYSDTEREPLYRVTIEHLYRREAEDILARYPSATVATEG